MMRRFLPTARRRRRRDVAAMAVVMLVGILVVVSIRHRDVGVDSDRAGPAAVVGASSVAESQVDTSWRRSSRRRRRAAVVLRHARRAPRTSRGDDFGVTSTVTTTRPDGVTAGALRVDPDHAGRPTRRSARRRDLGRARRHLGGEAVRREPRATDAGVRQRPRQGDLLELQPDDVEQDGAHERVGHAGRRHLHQRRLLLPEQPGVPRVDLRPGLHLPRVAVHGLGRRVGQGQGPDHQPVGVDRRARAVVDEHGQPRQGGARPAGPRDGRRHGTGVRDGRQVLLQRRGGRRRHRRVPELDVGRRRRRRSGPRTATPTS